MLIASGSTSIGYNHDYPLSLQSSIIVSGNFAVCGGSGIGFNFPFTDCASNITFSYSYNVAAFCEIGIRMNGNRLSKCVKTENISAFGNTIGLYSNLSQSNFQAYLSSLFLIDNSINIAGTFPTITLRNHYFIRKSYFAAISTPNWPNFYTSNNCYNSTMFDFNKKL